MVAREHLRPDVGRRRANVALARQFIPPGKLLWLDGAGARTQMTRRYGRSRVGNGVMTGKLFPEWVWRMLVPALTPGDEWLHLSRRVYGECRV